MPSIHFGGETIGEGSFATTEDVNALLEKLTACGIKPIDTAGVYPGSVPGSSERLLGDAKASQRGFTLNTKIMVIGDPPGYGSLKEEAINESVQRSPAALSVPRVGFL